MNESSWAIPLSMLLHEHSGAETLLMVTMSGSNHVGQ